jgi:protein gp37
MSESTDISWTDATINFWQGCRKISPGCKFCYMFRDKETRFGQDGNVIAKVSDRTINKTLKALTKPSKIFTCSWSDFFIKEADEWRDDAWKIIRDNPQHQWQILTKRPENIENHLPKNWGYGYENVWLGVSIEDDAHKYRLNLNSRLSCLPNRF